MRTRRDWMRWGALAILSAVTSQHVGAAPNCEDLTRPGLFPNTIVQTAVAVPADATTGTPAFCEVTAQISPVAGSKITAVFRLPDNWNGRMLGLGGGGFAGILDLRAPPFVTGPSRAADAGLPRGYATAQTDGGHPSPSRIDTSWIPNNPVAVTDFSHRAVHEMTVLGKGVIASYYGRPATKSYFQGCSTGGRMGLMEAQRYPDDYDGVVAGAPVHSLLTQSSTVVRDQIFKAPGAAVPVEQIKLVHEAVLSACDATDGLKDGVITDPRRCEWKPESLACKAGEAGGSCLTPPQVDALNAVYRTVRTPSGVVGNYGLTRGSEMGWNPIVMPTTPAGPRNFLNGNLGDLVPLMFGDSDFDHAKFDIQKQQEAIHRTAFAKEYEATSTDLRGFLRRGGKLLLWHGLDDVTTSPFGTIDYYESAVKANGGSDIRLFTLPGVDHCGGGLGANTFDPLAALEEWVEKGVEPNSMVAKSRAGGFERPVCAWPKLPYYRSGDPSKADSFVCR